MGKTGSARARVLRNAVVVVTLLLSVLCLTIGLRIFRVAANAALTITALRNLLTIIGAALLLSALIAMFSRRWRSIQAKIAFSLLFFLALLACAEVAARIAGYKPAPAHPSFTFWTVDDELGFVCQPNCELRILATKGWVDGTTDTDGFRPLITARDIPDAPEVICLGDSTTFSCEMEDDKTWPEAAARHLLAAGKPCRMLNRAGYGYSGVQSMLMLRRTLRKPGNYKAAVYHFCFNDPSENFAEFLPYPILVPSGGSFTVRPPPTPLLGTISDVRINPSFALLGAFRDWHFSTDDAAYRIGALGSYPYCVDFYSRFLKDQKQRDGMRFVISGMKEECDRHRIPLYVSAVTEPFWDKDGPSRSEIVSLLNVTNVVEDARIYNEACDTLRQIVTDCGAEYIDTRGCLDGMSYREYTAAPMDWHFSAQANERIGQAIAKRLEAQFK